MEQKNKKISVVVPCYNEELTVDNFYETCVPVLEKSGYDFEIIYVNDGSSDLTAQKLSALAEKDKRVKVASFSRNFGQQAAIICGFELASGDAVLEADCDLQDPPELFLKLIEKWEEGYEVVLCNSNPATIMTDTQIADKVYMEPLTLEYVARIIRYERPDAIIPSIGGQTGLNLAMQLEKKGVLRECRTELLGTKSESIERAEDRDLFKKLCEEIGEPVCPSEIAHAPPRPPLLSARGMPACRRNRIPPPARSRWDRSR